MSEETKLLRVPVEYGPLLALTLQTGDRALRHASAAASARGIAPRVLLPVEVRDALLAALDADSVRQPSAGLRRGYDAREAAAHLGITVGAVRKRIRAGHLSVARLADRSRSYVVDADQVDALASRKAAPHD